jgi:hypothetical protein
LTLLLEFIVVIVALSIGPDLLLSSKVKVEKLKPGKALANFVNSADFELNHCLVQARITIEQ